MQIYELVCISELYDNTKIMWIRSTAMPRPENQWNGHKDGLLKEQLKKSLYITGKKKYL